MEVRGSVALVTGASGGVGTEFVRQLIVRGAAKVYAVSRSGQAPDLPQVVGIKLDVTDSAAVENAGSQLRDVQLLVNNAGIATGESLVAGDLNEIRREFETNVFSGLSLAQTFGERTPQKQRWWRRAQCSVCGFVVFRSGSNELRCFEGGGQERYRRAQGGNGFTRNSSSGPAHGRN